MSARTLWQRRDTGTYQEEMPDVFQANDRRGSLNEQIKKPRDLRRHASYAF